MWISKAAVTHTVCVPYNKKVQCCDLFSLGSANPNRARGARIEAIFRSCEAPDQHFFFNLKKKKVSQWSFSSEKKHQKHGFVVRAVLVCAIFFKTCE